MSRGLELILYSTYSKKYFTILFLKRIVIYKGENTQYMFLTQILFGECN